MSDPLETVSKGAAIAAIEYALEKIPGLVQRFRDRGIAFIENKENIRTVKQERGSSEYALLSQFLPKKHWHRLVIQMGMALRDVERDSDRVADLREKILSKYGDLGLHIAELTQIGIVKQVVSRLTTIYSNTAEVERKLGAFLEAAEDMVLFVKKTDKGIPGSKARLVKTRVDTNPSHMMIIFGRGDARSIVYEILKKVAADKRGYVIEKEEVGLQVTAFIFTPEVKARLGHWSDAVRQN